MKEHAMTHPTKLKIRCPVLCLNSSDNWGAIFQLWGTIPCLLMLWLLKSPEHQQTWYWLCRTDSMYCCSMVNLWNKSGCLELLSDVFDSMVQDILMYFLFYQILQFIKGRCPTLTLNHVNSMSLGQKDAHKSLFSVWQIIFQMPKPKR